MKRKLTRCLAALLAAFLLLAPAVRRADAAGASFTGSGSLRPGDSVVVTFSVSGSGILAIQGSLTYDTGSLELTSVNQLVSSPWSMDMNGSTIVLYDASQTSPLSSASVFSATFYVKSGVSPGTTVSATVSGISVTDGNADSSLGSATWSATIAAPLSDNANLSSLSCSNASLSPSFSAGTTTYSCTVPYDVTELALSYSTADDGAWAWTYGNDLVVGSNTVSVVVTAANGNTRYYNIYVTRQQDPNYVPSSNALLSELTVSPGTLSPAFTPEGKEYVVYLPYEVESAQVSGVAQDGKALSVTGSSSDKLKVGDNPLTVVCLAEDNATRQTYTVHVYRMPAFAGRLPEIKNPDLADYTAVDAALAKVPADLTLYTDESARAVRDAVKAVKRDLAAKEQKQVDAMAQAIEKAVKALEEKPAPEPEPEPTPAEKFLSALGGEITIPYLSAVTGPLSFRTLAIAALVLLLLLAYLIGTLVGRAVGRRRALRGPKVEEDDEDEYEDEEIDETPAPEEDVTPPAPPEAETPAAPETPETPDAPEPEAPAEDEALTDTERKLNLDEILDDIKRM